MASSADVAVSPPHNKPETVPNLRRSVRQRSHRIAAQARNSHRIASDNKTCTIFSKNFPGHHWLRTEQGTFQMGHRERKVNNCSLQALAGLPSSFEPGESRWLWEEILEINPQFHVLHACSCTLLHAIHSNSIIHTLEQARNLP